MISINEFIEKVKETLEINTDIIVSPETYIKDVPNWSSMNALMFMITIETEYNTSLANDDMRKCVTVMDLYNLISKKK